MYRINATTESPTVAQSEASTSFRLSVDPSIILVVTMDATTVRKNSLAVHALMLNRLSTSRFFFLWGKLRNLMEIRLNNIVLTNEWGGEGVTLVKEREEQESKGTRVKLVRLKRLCQNFYPTTAALEPCTGVIDPCEERRSGPSTGVYRRTYMGAWPVSLRSLWLGTISTIRNEGRKNRRMWNRHLLVPGTVQRCLFISLHLNLWQNLGSVRCIVGSQRRVQPDWTNDSVLPNFPLIALVSFNNLVRVAAGLSGDKSNISSRW